MNNNYSQGAALLVILSTPHVILNEVPHAAHGTTEA
jgi:hypothetical protein